MRALRRRAALPARRPRHLLPADGPHRRAQLLALLPDAPSASRVTCAPTRVRSRATCPRCAPRGSSPCRGSSRSSRPRWIESGRGREIRPRCATSSASDQLPPSTRRRPVLPRDHRVLPLDRPAARRALGHDRDDAIGAFNPPEKDKSGRSARRCPASRSGSPTTARSCCAATVSCAATAARSREDAETIDRRRLAAHGRHRRARRRRLPLDRRPQEGADHQRRGQEHVAGEHRETLKTDQPADRLRPS